MIAGYEAVRTELERELPPVTLLLGADGNAKLRLAQEILRKRSMTWHFYRPLTASVARDIVVGAPVRRPRADLYVIDLEGAVEAAQNILLKTLEAPPPHARFMLLAARRPLLTVMSRSRVFQIGAVLADLPELDTRVLSVVAAAVRAATAGNTGAVELSLRNWTTDHTAALRYWATEAASGRWRVFSAEFAPRATRGGALRVLEVLSSFSVPAVTDRPEARTAPAVALAALKETR